MSCLGDQKAWISGPEAEYAGIRPRHCSNNIFSGRNSDLVLFPLLCFFWCNDNMAKQDISYVRIQTPDDPGYLVRTHRNNKQLTLETFSELSQLNMQFLSDFEQGKNTGEIGPTGNC